MLSALRCIFFALVVGLPMAVSAADDPSTNGVATISMVGPVDIRLSSNQTLTPPLKAKVVDANGAPLPNVRVGFSVNEQICIPLQPCPDHSALYGHFADPNASVETDVTGVATAPSFVAGIQSGQYQVFAWAGAYTVGQNPAIGPSSIYAFATITQASSIDATPVLSRLGLVALGLAVFAVSAIRLRSGRQSQG